VALFHGLAFIIDAVSGWDVGVAGMQIGGEREIIVPPAMGYGSRGMPGIPPNSTLIFGEWSLCDKSPVAHYNIEVKCLEIK